MPNKFYGLLLLVDFAFPKACDACSSQKYAGKSIVERDLREDTNV